MISGKIADKYSESKLDEIVEWMNQFSELYGCATHTKKGLIQILEENWHYKYGDKWLCGGFEFKKTKKGLYILPIRCGKILTPKTIKKDRIKTEIQERKSGWTFKCPVCERYAYNGYCSECGYKRPSDKLIVELWNQKKTLQEMMLLLDEPNTTYIKTRLRKYNLQNRIGYIQERYDEQIHSVYAWENINEKCFPVLKEGEK